jgi:hypothetical protein
VPEEPAASRLLRDLALILERFGDRWYLFGAQAVVIWGRPRMTADVDVTAFLDPDEIEAFVVAMEQSSFSLRVPDPQDFVRKTRVLPFLHAATGLPLDVVLGGPGPEEEFANAARRIEIGGTKIPVIAPEDLVVTKILAGRPKDLDDVEGILTAQRDILDLERIRSLLHALETALSQSDLSPTFEARLTAVMRTPRSR